VNAQNYNDYLGAGHDLNVTVTTSSHQNSNRGAKTVDGFPLDNPDILKDASRFLAQSTMGYNYDMIQVAASMGYENWIDDQLKLPAASVTNICQEIMSKNAGNDEEDLFGMYLFRSAWWNLILQKPDILRQRVTYSLSQIFVVSGFGSDFFEDTHIMSSDYYDILNRNALGNYRDLLLEITQSPSMGMYLSHLNNPKSDPANNIHPDENYAREIMQLFSIGLYELNNNGTRKLDNLGNFIPTYDNNTIKEFAKIFTGFGPGCGECTFGLSLDDDIDIEEDFTQMKMYDEWHEPGEKHLLNGFTVPAGQSGLKDVEDAIDNLFNHPNVGPFIGKALIKLLVTANPSPAYVGRVADAFNDNGEGVRGDLGAVVKAILMDEEARDCNALTHPTNGKLREPLIRYTGFMRAFGATPHEDSDGLFLSFFDGFLDNTGQAPMFAPSVFNFYSPDYQPQGMLAAMDLFAPTFQIHNSSTSIGFVNQVDTWLFDDAPLPDAPEDVAENSGVVFDFSKENELLDNPTALIDHLDILLACGQLSQKTKNIIVNAISQAEEDEDKLDLAIYLILISPEYAVLK
jgi:uncharacterized protein (DUF1800 family)